MIGGGFADTASFPGLHPGYTYSDPEFFPCLEYSLRIRFTSGRSSSTKAALECRAVLCDMKWAWSSPPAMARIRVHDSSTSGFFCSRRPGKRPTKMSLNTMICTVIESDVDERGRIPVLPNCCWWWTRTAEDEDNTICCIQTFFMCISVVFKIARII